MHAVSELATGLSLICGILALPAPGQVTARVSLNTSGGQPNDACFHPTISVNGRFVTFWSHATNLAPGNFDGYQQVFVRDRELGTTECASVSSSEVVGNDESSYPNNYPPITDDGRFVAFTSYASNLVAGDTNAELDVFVRDRQLGTTERVSVDSSGAQVSGGSAGRLTLSSDGRFVTFVSNDGFVPEDTNGMSDVYVRDRQLRTTRLVSVDSSGGLGDGTSAGAWITTDGRYVAFWSTATNLVSGDTNGRYDVFVRDLELGTTERVSVDSAGVEANHDSTTAAISADGRYVAFRSFATNLVAGDTNASFDAFVHDRQTGATERVSVDSSGAEGSGTSDQPSLSADGRYVAFWSDAALVPGDTNGYRDVFVRDRQLGTTERVSVSSAGEEGDLWSEDVRISSDGGYVAFRSWATNLVPGDTNDWADIFVRVRVGGTDFTNLCEPGASGVISCPCSNPPSGSGRGCDNSASTGGAVLSAAGGAFLSSDSLVFTTSGEKPTALSILLQGTTVVSGGIVYGQGVRCVGGTLKRLFAKSASGGSITAPDYAAGDPTVRQRSAALGSPISAGQSRWYLVFYRDPIVLGGCPATSTFNATQTGEVAWAP